MVIVSSGKMVNLCRLDRTIFLFDQKEGGGNSGPYPCFHHLRLCGRGAAMELYGATNVGMNGAGR
jgi:hypothetical protein